MSLLHGLEFSKRSSWKSCLRQSFDRVLASLFFIMLSPLFLLIALWVKLSLGSPVIFKQKRGGLHGKPFYIYKFRTMLEKYDSQGELLPDSERLVGSGRILRALSLDELPQLWNVIRGDMRLVGPRPVSFHYLSFYSSEQYQRMQVLPGMTGWAQIKGRKSLSWEEKFDLDVWYVKNQSFWLDIKILLITLGLLINPKKIIEVARSCETVFDKARRIRLPSWPEYSVDDVMQVMRALSSEREDSQEESLCQVFERAVADYLGVPYVLAIKEGRLAFHIMLKVLGVKPGDKVVLPANALYPTTEYIVQYGAQPVLADIDELSQTVTADTLSVVLDSSIKAVVVCHFVGWPCDMASIMTLANNHQISVIELCSEAYGASYQGHRVGSLGTVGFFELSLQGYLSVGGQGALLVTSDEALYSRVVSYRTTYGRRLHAESMSYLDSDPLKAFKGLWKRLPINGQLESLQSTVGCVQLKKLASWLDNRRHWVQLYVQAFKPIEALSVCLPADSDDEVTHALHQLCVRVDVCQLKKDWSVQRIVTALIDKGIPCQSADRHALSTVGQSKLEILLKNSPVASALSAQLLFLPLYPSLREIDVQVIADQVVRLIKQAVI